MSPEEGTHAALIEESLDYGETDFHIKLMIAFDPNRNHMRMYAGTLREGRIDLGGRQVAFALRGERGIYDTPYNIVYFDTDGDGRLETTTRNSDEAYQIQDGVVNLEGVTYEFAVSRDGESLTLKPLAERLPDRIPLAPGNPAPDFLFVDLDGFAGRLSDYRGKYLLLYFWHVGCGPCRKQTPMLVDAYARFSEFGFEILGIDKGDSLEVVREYVEKHGVSWRQIMQDDDGPIIKRYRVIGYPTFILIDPEGTILEARFPSIDLESELSRILKPTSSVD
jgi:peroxiredoxin